MNDEMVDGDDEIKLIFIIYIISSFYRWQIVMYLRLLQKKRLEKRRDLFHYQPSYQPSSHDQPSSLFFSNKLK